MEMIELICTNCGKHFIERYKGQKHKKNHQCSAECAKKYQSKISSITMAKTNRKYASERMIKNNPMKNPVTRAKVSTTLRAMNHKPKIQGGNGRGLTSQQKILSLALGWDCEVVVCTKMGRQSGYPSCYKIDIGNEVLKIGVEVDGSSHNSLDRKRQDIKKDTFLTSLGWKIIRIKNQEIDNDLDSCINKVRALYC